MSVIVDEPIGWDGIARNLAHHDELETGLAPTQSVAPQQLGDPLVLTTTGNRARVI